MKETDLYLPVKEFLVNQGYTVKAEVMNCDIVAVDSDNNLVIVELKKTACLKILLQAVDRKALSENVYIGILASSPILKSSKKSFIKTLKMLGLGLLVIDPHLDYVFPMFDPAEYRPQKKKSRQKRLLKQFNDLVGDPNTGGSRRTGGIMTPYRYKAITIAEYITTHGPDKASNIKNLLGIPNTWSILYNNVYGWFEKQDKGIYYLSPRGEKELPVWLTKIAG